MLMRCMCTHCFSRDSGVDEEREEGERLFEREPSISRQAHCRQSRGRPTLGERAVISWHRFSHTPWLVIPGIVKESKGFSLWGSDNKNSKKPLTSISHLLWICARRHSQTMC